MKNFVGKSIMSLALASVLVMGCNSKADKRIAELEGRIAEMEAKKPANGQATATPIPGDPAAASEQKPEGPLPAFEFETTDHDFGTINEGDEVTYTYNFKNTGEAPLIIQGAQGSCGCTVPDWSKEPIPVGGSGYVKAKFDSHGKQNAQSKTVTVTANTFPKQTVLRFKAMVTPKASTDMGPLKK